MRSTAHNDFIKVYAKRLLYSNKAVSFENRRLYQPDIVAVDWNLNVIEYEVKMSEINLLNELNIISRVFKDRGDTISLTEAVLSDKVNKFKSQAHRRKNKYAKHALYLKNKVTPDRLDYRPNYFYWVLPYQMWENQKGRLKTLPYGVIAIKDESRTVQVKKALSLHDAEIDSAHLWEMVYTLSRKVITEIK